jgi:hypothetical protein
MFQAKVGEKVETHFVLNNLFFFENRAVNPFNAAVNPTCHLLALLGAHHILHVSRVRVNEVMWKNI